MPKIAEFFGILIYMYHRDHAPPHFHATYAEYEVLISITDLRVIQGSLPPRALGMVMEWAALHQSALIEDWNIARDMQSLKPIPPLK